MQKVSIINWVPNRPYIALILSGLFFAFFAMHAGNARQMNNVDYFTVENEDTRYYQEFKKLFPKSEFFTISFRSPDIFTQPNLSLLKQLTERLAKIHGVLEVKSLANVEYIEGENDNFMVRQFLEEVPEEQSGLAKLKRDALSEELYVPNLISADGSAVSLVVFVEDKSDDDSFRRNLLKTVDSELSAYKEHVDHFYKAGWTITNNALSRILQEDLKVFVPLTFILITASIYILFKNWVLVGIAALNIAACLISIIGLFGLSGITINNLTAIAIPVGLTLSLADTVHIFSNLKKERFDKSPSKPAALAGILSQLIKPCFFTSLTTAFGFLSLGMSSISAMKDFAAITSLAMMFEFFYSFYFLPALLALVPAQSIFSEGRSAGEQRLSRMLQNWYLLLTRRYLVVIAIALCSSFIAIHYLFKVPVETNVIKFFREDSELISELNFVEANVGGVGSFDLSFTTGTRDGIKAPEVLHYIDQIGAYLKSLPGVDSVTSLPDFFKDMNQAFHSDDPGWYKVPESIEMIEQYLLLYDGKDLENVVNKRFDHAKSAIRISLHSTREQQELLGKVREFLKDSPPPEALSVRPTGHAVNYTNVAHEMVDSQISSFGTAIIVIGFMMMFLLRSIKLGLLSLVPNIFPILLTFGVMGLFSIPLDTGTVMIASVSLGIACDDTVHFLFFYNQKLRDGLSIPEALKTVLLQKGKAIISTTIILTIGFAVLLFGQFIPVVNFGKLCTLTMVSAIVGDLVVLPALIILRNRKHFNDKADQ